MTTVYDLAEQLKSGSISMSTWEAGMRDFNRDEVTTAMILAKGGRDFVTPSDWGFVGSQVKAQYGFLTGFKNDIASNPDKWLNGNALNARADLYGQLGYAALEQDIGREHEKDGYTEERSVAVAHDDKNCDDCLEEEARGWVGIGEISPIGSRRCCTNDRCSMEYRKPDGNGGWIYGND